MFALTDDDLEPQRSSAVAMAPQASTQKRPSAGCRVVSCDPIYGFRAAEISARIAATRDQVLEQTRKNAGEFVWNDVIPDGRGAGSGSAWRRCGIVSRRLRARKDRQALHRGGATRHSRSPIASFDLALCSHFLFLYTSQLDEAFHQEAAARALPRRSGSADLPAAGPGRPTVPARRGLRVVARRVRARALSRAGAVRISARAGTRCCGFFRPGG